MSISISWLSAWQSVMKIIMRIRDNLKNNFITINCESVKEVRDVEALKSCERLHTFCGNKLRCRVRFFEVCLNKLHLFFITLVLNLFFNSYQLHCISQQWGKWWYARWSGFVITFYRYIIITFYQLFIVSPHVSLFLMTSFDKLIYINQLVIWKRLLTMVQKSFWSFNFYFKE